MEETSDGTIKLLWRKRELSLRRKVLESQLENILKMKEASSELCKSRSLGPLKSSESDAFLQLLECCQVRHESLSLLSEKLVCTKQKILDRTRMMLHQIWDVYPIVEFPDSKGYSICDIHLPGSDNFEGHDETMLSVAIGYVSHLLLLLGDLLDIALRFPIKYYGSKSLIYCNRKSQLFPLFLTSIKSREWVNFSYGMSLLNLDIVQIRTLHGLSTTNPEETLANLHGLKQTLDREVRTLS